MALSVTRRTQLWHVAVLAFLAMMANDAFCTVMVVFESQYNAYMAGLFDVLGWITGLVCAALAIESIITQGWRTRRSLTIITAVSLANFWGTWLGVLIAAGITHHH